MTERNQKTQSSQNQPSGVGLPFGKRLHPLAEHVPPMQDDELAELVGDVKANKLRDKITLDHTGRFLVDGRHRLLACEQAGVKPKFERLPKNINIASFIVSKLIHRNLTASQRAAIAAELMSELKGRKGVNNDTAKGKTRERAAKAMGVSEGYVHAAAKLKKEEPEKFEDVKAGKLKLSKATPMKARNGDKPRARTPVQPRMPDAAPPKLPLDVDPADADFTPSVNTPDADIWKRVRGWTSNLRGLLTILGGRGVNVEDGVEHLVHFNEWVGETTGTGAVAS